MWSKEESRARDLAARTVQIPPLGGGESERVLLRDIFDRKVWFPNGGIYIMRAEDAVMYVGLTVKPIRWRLRMAICHDAPWTLVPEAEYLNWTLTMQTPREWPDDHGHEVTLIRDLKPIFNVRGRPRKARVRTAYCQCKGVCPACGLELRPRLESTAGGTSAEANVK